MIKEKAKHTKYNFKKNKTQLIIEYIRTFFCSILVALVITISLAMHARNEMIKDIYNSKYERNLLSKNVAIELIAQNNYIDDIKNKPYSVCMHVGEIYEAAGKYAEAQNAYENAIKKMRFKSYNPYYCLIRVLIEQEKYNDANAVLDNLDDISNLKFIKFKTRAYLTIGDKYYSNGKFLSAVKNYEKANFYYSKLSKKDKVVLNSIENRIIQSYLNAADIMVKSGLNSEAVRFLGKARHFNPDSFIIKYKLAIVLSESDPEKSIDFFEDLLDEIPQEIDYGVFNSALMRAANIADLDGRPAKAKYYRYKIHSNDLFINRKVVYKNDIEVILKSINIKKKLFKYPINAVYQFSNISNVEIINLTGDFVLCLNDKPVETITRKISSKSNPLSIFEESPHEVNVNFARKVLTKKELENYTIKIYLYKDEKYKTLVSENLIPNKSF